MTKNYVVKNYVVFFTQSQGRSENLLKQNCSNKYSQMTILHELLRFSSKCQGLNQENIPAKKQLFAKSEIKTFSRPGLARFLQPCYLLLINAHIHFLQY